MAGPAAAVTRDRPCWALDVYSDAVAEALEAVCFAVSAAFVVVEVDSKRTMRRPIERPDRLVTRAKDMIAGKSPARDAWTDGGSERREWRGDGGRASAGGSGVVRDITEITASCRCFPNCQKNWPAEARKKSLPWFGCRANHKRQLALASLGPGACSARQPHSLLPAEATINQTVIDFLQRKPFKNHLLRRCQNMRLVRSHAIQKFYT
jgi:hypothetical protein